jgi:hypothetical protein
MGKPELGGVALPTHSACSRYWYAFPWWSGALLLPRPNQGLPGPPFRIRTSL